MSKSTRMCKKLKISKYHNESILVSRFPFRYQPFEEPRLARLRDIYNLESVIEGGRTEFEKLVILRNWINSRWQHGWSNSVPPTEALKILKLAEKGERFHCAYYAAVFSQCCVALGFQSRIVGVCKKNIDFRPWKSPQSVSHTTTEIWSNDFKKWAIMDADINAYYEFAGVPLNAYEIREKWLNGEWAKIKLVRSSSKKFICSYYPGSPFSQIQINKTFANVFKYNLIDHYDYIWVEMCNDYFSPPKPPQCLQWADRVSPQRFMMMGVPLDEHLITSNVNDMYWSLNQTSINLKMRLKEKQSQPYLEVKLENSTPNFKNYLVQFDGGKWQKRQEEFMWKLHGGENQIRAKTVNMFGREGIISNIKVKVF